MKNTSLLRKVVASVAAIAVAGVSMARLTDPNDPNNDYQSISVEIGLLVYGINCSGGSAFPPADYAACQICCESSSVVQGNWWARYGCLLGCWSTFIPQEAEV